MDNLEQSIRSFIVSEFMDGQENESVDGELLLGDVIDSLGLLRLITYLEEDLGANIEPEDVVLDNFESVSAIANLVRQRRDA